MIGRIPFGYVVSIEGSNVTLNLKDEHRGQLAAHREGVSSVTEYGSLFGVLDGYRLLLLRVKSLSFMEPREAHRAGVGSSALNREPLRVVIGNVLGVLSREESGLAFKPDSLISPALGAEAFPLSEEELQAVLEAPSSEREANEVELGRAVRGGSLKVGAKRLLGRHVAVLGSTGQGKSCFTAAVLQQFLRGWRLPRIVVFDVNGEYEQALAPHLPNQHDIRLTTLGGNNPDLRIPYYALGRHGLSRLLLPSEKTQRPALSFALDMLRYVRWFSGPKGAGLINGDATLFDDCRPEGALGAWETINALRNGTASPALVWPPMSALGCLVAESHALKINPRSRDRDVERDSFHYGNVAPLVTRIRRLVEDPLFNQVVDTEGGRGGSLNWEREGARLVSTIFGDGSSRWKLHVVNLRSVAHDLMPMVLGSLLELFAFELFRRGQDRTYPTLLVLEEAHHYLRQVVEGDESARETLAYERLAKEGRKFGLSLWVSTQRPSEISPTVLGQCGTWVVFRLTGEQDLRAIGNASEWFDRGDLGRIGGLQRQHALVLGGSVAIPTRIIAPEAKPRPRSDDPPFDLWMSDSLPRDLDSFEEVEEPHEEDWGLPDEDSDLSYEDDDAPF